MPLPRQLLPAAPMEPFAGWVNVHEVPGELGGHLLVLHRSVLLWAQTPPAERGALFERVDAEHAPGAPEADGPAEIRAALRDLGELRRSPDRHRPAAVSRACDALSEWAEAAGYPGTALAWARAAAAAHPANVRAAYRVGTLVRRRADYPTAEAWLQHARETAWRYRDEVTHALALNGLGNLSTQRGDFVAARAFLGKALRAAQHPRGRVEEGRRQLRELEGEVLHDLLTVSVYEGDFAGAERFAAEAFERMRAGHQRLPVLAHDVAGLWMERGYFGRALPVFEAVLPLLRDPHERLLVGCNLARCAGAEGRVGVYARAAAGVWELIRDAVPGTVPAGVYTNLARGAAGLCLWEDAERAAVIAAEVAEVREEADQASAVAPLLESIRLHRYADAPAEPVSPLKERAARSLVAGLVESLNAMQAGD